jgi:MFS family permease
MVGQLKSRYDYGILVIIFGTLGLWFGGKLADNFTKKGNKDGKVRAVIYLIAGVFLTCWLFPLMPTGEWAAVAMTPLIFFVCSPLGAGTAAIAEVTPNRMRAMTSAFYLLMVNLIGLVFGPLSVALLTDKYFHDTTMIRYSILIVMAAGSFLGVFFMYLSLKAYRKMITRELPHEMEMTMNILQGPFLKIESCKHLKTLFCFLY